MTLSSTKNTTTKNHQSENIVASATQENIPDTPTHETNQNISFEKNKRKIKLKFGFKKKIPTLEKATLFRYISTMVGAGLPIPEAIEVYAKDSQIPKLKKILSNTQQELQQGKTLSNIFSQYPDTFDKTTVSIIHAGELSGTLTTSLEYLSKQLYSQYQLKQKVKGAMMYPIIILSAMSGVGTLLIFFVLPKIAPIFLSMSLTLPTFSRIILEGGLWVSQNSLIVFPIFGAIVVSIILSLSRPAGKQLALKIFSLIPAIKHLLNQLDLARFSRTLSTLLASGVPISNSLRIVIESLSQSKYNQLANQFQTEIEKGRALSEIMRKHHKLFPNMLIRMVATGEKTGSIDNMLTELAEHYEKEIDSTLSNFTSILEPVLLLLVGIGVGIMVLAVIAPIYSLVGGIEGQ